MRLGGLGLRGACLVGSSGEDPQRAGVGAAEPGLDGHVQVPRALQLAGERERPGVEDQQTGALGELADRSLRLLVVGGDEDVERLTRHLAGH